MNQSMLIPNSRNWPPAFYALPFKLLVLKCGNFFLCRPPKQGNGITQQQFGSAAQLIHVDHVTPCEQVLFTRILFISLQTFAVDVPFPVLFKCCYSTCFNYCLRQPVPYTHRPLIENIAPSVHIKSFPSFLKPMYSGSRFPYLGWKTVHSPHLFPIWFYTSLQETSDSGFKSNFT